MSWVTWEPKSTMRILSCMVRRGLIRRTANGCKNRANGRVGGRVFAVQKAKGQACRPRNVWAAGRCSVLSEMVATPADRAVRGTVAIEIVDARIEATVAVMLTPIAVDGEDDRKT